jgi:putative membrane protein
MFRQFLVSLFVVAAAVWVTALIVPSVEVDGGVLTYLWIAILFGLVNAILGPILHILALPLTVLTLGLFALVVNGALLGITAWLSGDLLNVGGFWGTVLGALVISVVMALLWFLTKGLRPQEEVAA